MNNGSRRFSLILCLILISVAGHVAADAPAGTAPITSSSSESIAEAKNRFERGVSLYRDGDFAGARIEFRRAYELAPNFRILYNLGQVSFALRDYATALRFFRDYLDAGGASVPRERRAEVRAEIARLEERVGFLEIRVDRQGAEVTVDDVVVGQSPIATPLAVNVGSHRVTVVSGSHVATRVVEVPGRETVVVELTIGLPPVASASVRPNSPSPRDRGREPKNEPNRRSVVISWSLTAALAAAAGISAYLAYDASRDLDRERDTYPGSRRRLDSLRDTTHRRAIITDALLATAVVAAGVSLYFTVRSGRPRNERRTPAAGPRRGPELQIGIVGSSVQLEGNF